MGKIMLLDCTLRDGGYVNNWNFGKNAILDIERKLVSTGVDIVEIGFLKKEPYDPNRTVFSAEEQIHPVIAPKKKGVLYAAMVEVQNPLPVAELSPKSESSVDIIRIIVWKRLLKEGFEYCKAIADKGYKICIQPARVNQYSEEEFIQMIELFNQISPLAVYVVDSWGTQNKEDIVKYASIANKHLKDDIALGFHGHNNMQQAFSCAEAVIDLNLDRDIIIDASIFGIGRGAGNLNIELFANYLNAKHNKKYDIKPMLEIYADYINEIYARYPWGYTIPHFLTAVVDCNPEYAFYYGAENKLPANQILDILLTLSVDDKVIFSKETAERYLEKYSRGTSAS